MYSAHDLRLRAPGSAVIAETLRVQALAPPQSRLARVFGRSPLSVEAEAWYLGAVGELEVARLLGQLGPDWCVLHAVPIGVRGSDIDHIVIGPGGVFTINAKYHEGARVWVGARRLLVNGQKTDHLRNATTEARRVAQALSGVMQHPIEVRALIVIVAARALTVKEAPAAVTVLRAEALVRWLRRRPVVHSADEIEQIAGTAAAPGTWGEQELAVADLPAFEALRARVRAARHRRRLWAVGAALAGAGVCLTAYGLLPMLSTALVGLLP